MWSKPKHAIWTLIGGSLVVVASAWAIYVSSFYLFLARAFPMEAREGDVSSAGLASIQAYAVAFGPLAILIVATSIWLLLRRRKARD